MRYGAARRPSPRQWSGRGSERFPVRRDRAAWAQCTGKPSLVVSRWQLIVDEEWCVRAGLFRLRKQTLSAAGSVRPTANDQRLNDLAAKKILASIALLC